MRTIIITGANGNLGVKVAQKFLNEGFRVLAPVIDEKAAAGLPKHDQLLAFVTDLGNEAKAQEFAENMLTKYPESEGALMLAGGFAMGDLEHTGEAEIDQQLRLNFKTAYFLTRTLYAHLATNGGGRLVFIGSRPAIDPGSGSDTLAYALSKSLLFQLASIINSKTRLNKVRATVVVPGIIDTPGNRQAMPGANFAEWVDPEVLADLLVFLFSPTAEPLRDTVLKVYNQS